MQVIYRTKSDVGTENTTTTGSPAAHVRLVSWRRQPMSRAP